jgi:hypothetical protein
VLGQRLGHGRLESAESGMGSKGLEPGHHWDTAAIRCK